MKFYLGLLAAFVALTNAECANGSCGKEIVQTVSAYDDTDGCGSKDDSKNDSKNESKDNSIKTQKQGKSVVTTTPTRGKGKRPYTIDNCPYCNKRGCRWCEWFRSLNLTLLINYT